jgi:hypothetical protein
MTTMFVELYETLRAADTPEDKAQATARDTGAPSAGTLSLMLRSFPPG